MSTNNKRNARQATLQLLGQYIYRDKPLLIRCLLLLFFSTAASVSGPLIAKYFIDEHLLPQSFDTQALLLLAAAYLFSQLAAASFGYFQTLGFSQIALTAVQDIRERVFDHVMRLPMSYFDHSLTGQLVSRITNDTEAIKDLYLQFMSVVLGNLMLLLGILIAMTLLDVQLMLIALALIPTVIAVIYLYEKFSGSAARQARQLRSEINAGLSESISGIAVLQATNQQQRFSDRFDQVNQDYYLARMRTIKVSAALLRPAIDLLAVLVMMAVVAFFGLQVVEGVAEVGVLYAFLSFLGRFTEPLAEITQRFNLYQQAMVAGQRVNQMLQENEQHYQTSQAAVDKGAVDIHDLHFAYNPKKPVLRGLNITIKPGDFYAVVGHTGSGKSTLLNLLLNFYQPTQGEICFDQQPLPSFGHDNLRQGIGLIPQEPFIIAGSIRDNIDMGRQLSDQQIQQAVAKAHLTPLIDTLADGLETELGERGTRLSTGQRQQLVIARALAASPKILLLDEATANVDSETEQIVQRALHELRGNVTMIMVAHRLSTIKAADQILVLAQGQISERGKHRQLMEKTDGLYRSMYLLQQQAKKVAQAETSATTEHS